MGKPQSLAGFQIRRAWLALAILVLAAFVVIAFQPEQRLSDSRLLFPSGRVLVSASEMTALALCGLVVFLIAALLFQRRKCAEAERLKQQSDKALFESEECAASLIESSMDAIIVTDYAQRVVQFNAAAERIFDCRSAEAVGSSIERFFPQSVRAAYRAHISHLAETGIVNRLTLPPGTSWGLRATGEEFPIAASIFQAAFHGTKLFTVVMRDISDRNKAELAARESEERFHLVVDMTPILVWMSGANTLCTYFNKAWLDFTGRPMELELGNGWMEGIYAEDLARRMEVYKRSFDRREEFRTEYRLRRHDAEYRWMLDIGVPRFGPDHSFAGYIGSCIDITDRKRAESERVMMREEIAHLNRVASMGQMAASLAHELAQPLAAILSNAQAAARFADQPKPDLEEVRGALADIIEDNKRARAFVNNLRSMFQRQTITRTSLDLNRIACDVSRLVRNDALRRRVRISLIASPETILVSGDTIVLQQVLLNLVNNGMDALQALPSEQRMLTLTTLVREGSGYGTILVEDNGYGIAEENKPKLFTPFFTTKKDGLGMGLSICRSLIESLDGCIKLLDRDAPGAVFQVDLPLIVSNSPQNQPHTQSE